MMKYNVNLSFHESTTNSAFFTLGYQLNNTQDQNKRSVIQPTDYCYILLLMDWMPILSSSHMFR